MHLPICQIGVMNSVATPCPHPRNWEETARTGKPWDQSMLSSPGLRKHQLRRTLGQVLSSRDVWILFCGKEIWDGVSKTSHFNPKVTWTRKPFVLRKWFLCSPKNSEVLLVPSLSPVLGGHGEPSKLHTFHLSPHLAPLSFVPFLLSLQSLVVSHLIHFSCTHTSL